MKRIHAHPLVLISALLLAPSAAMAADGMVCYSSIMTLTGSSGFGTTTYPQMTNATTFTCTTTAPYTFYTIKQLSAAGWIIISVQPTVYSSTMNSDGTYVTKTRMMLVLQK